MATSVPPSSTQKSWADVQFFQSLGPSGIFSKRHYKNVPKKHSFPYFSKWIKSFLNTPRISFEDSLWFSWTEAALFFFFSYSKGVEAKPRGPAFRVSQAFCVFASGGLRDSDVFCHAGCQNNVFCSVKNSIPSKKKPTSLQSLQGRISSKKIYFGGVHLILFTNTLSHF